MHASLSSPSQDDDYLHTFRHAFDETFGWEVRRGLELAIFHTFAVPAISEILDGTGEFTHRAQKRYDDTVAVLREIARDGPASPRGRAAIRRMNWIHRPYRISNDDLIYVLATFIVIPVRWIGRYGWRDLTAEEIRAAVQYYRTVGRLMGIRQLPQTYPEFAGYLDAYEREHHSFTEANRRLADSLITVIGSWAPRLARPAARSSVAAILGSRLRRDLGLPEPSRLIRAGVHAALLARAAVKRLIPPLRRPRRSPRRLRSYPHGYALSEVGPAWATGRSQARPSPYRELAHDWGYGKQQGTGHWSHRLHSRALRSRAARAWLRRPRDRPRRRYRRCPSPGSVRGDRRERVLRPRASAS